MRNMNAIHRLIRSWSYLTVPLFVAFCLIVKTAVPSEVLRVELLLQQANFGLVGPERRAFANYLVEAATENNLDPLLVLAVMQVESRFQSKALSNRGAMGLLQLKPIAAREVADRLTFELKSKHDLFDPFKNLAIGIEYLSFLREVVGSDLSRMLVAYNAGPYATKKMNNLPQGYIKKVMKAYQGFQEI